MILFRFVLLVVLLLLVPFLLLLMEAAAKNCIILAYGPWSGAGEEFNPRVGSACLVPLRVIGTAPADIISPCSGCCCCCCCCCCWWGGSSRSSSSCAGAGAGAGAAAVVDGGDDGASSGTSILVLLVLALILLCKLFILLELRCRVGIFNIVAVLDDLASCFWKIISSMKTAHTAHSLSSHRRSMSCVRYCTLKMALLGLFFRKASLSAKNVVAN